MSTNNSVPNDPSFETKASDPIPIDTPRGRSRRARSESTSDSSVSSASPSSPPPQTPVSARTSVSPSTSPILSYFLGQSPTKSPSYPFSRTFAAPSAIEDEEEQEGQIPFTTHARRVSTGWSNASIFGQPPIGPIPDAQQERGKGLLRRLSLGGALQTGRPVFPVENGRIKRPLSPPVRSGTPPNGSPRTGPVPVSPRRAQRAATLGVATGDTVKHRAPSPMGERILKGHFDGFN